MVGGMELSGDFNLVKYIIGKAHDAWGALMPRPDFGPPTQAFDAEEHGDAAWYHIPITVKRSWFLGSRFIPCCETAALIFTEDGKSPLHKLSMVWNRNRDAGLPEVTLIEGFVRTIPLVMRQDGAEAAVVTDADFLQKEREPEFIELSPGNYRFVITVTSGVRTWHSPAYYVLRVPKKDASNSHFNLHIGDLIKQRK